MDENRQDSYDSEELLAKIVGLFAAGRGGGVRPGVRGHTAFLALGFELSSDANQTQAVVRAP
jgi:hypothetical protein